MTLAEFKAWFDGFTEDMDEAPTAKQWKRIKARVKEIDGTPVTYPVYVDRYWPYVAPLAPVYPRTPVWTCTTGGTSLPNSQQAIYNNVPFNGVIAMNALGKAEASEGWGGLT